jgi:hypothetical protein
MTARVASAPDDVKPRCAQLLRFASALRVTSSSAAAKCRYAESGAFGLHAAATIIKAASARPFRRRPTINPSTKPGQAHSLKEVPKAGRVTPSLFHSDLTRGHTFAFFIRGLWTVDRRSDPYS